MLEEEIVRLRVYEKSFHLLQWQASALFRKLAGDSVPLPSCPSEGGASTLSKDATLAISHPQILIWESITGSTNDRQSQHFHPTPLDHSWPAPSGGPINSLLRNPQVGIDFVLM